MLQREHHGGNGQHGQDCKRWERLDEIVEVERGQDRGADRDAASGGQCRQGRMVAASSANAPRHDAVHGQPADNSEQDPCDRREQALVNRVLDQEDPGESDGDAAEPNHPVDPGRHPRTPSRRPPGWRASLLAGLRPNRGLGSRSGCSRLVARRSMHGALKIVDLPGKLANAIPQDYGEPQGDESYHDDLVPMRQARRAGHPAIAASMPQAPSALGV